MADNASIFSGDNPTATQTESAAAQAVSTGTATQTQSDIVAALVGEGKKYKDVSDLAKAYVHADDFIEKLKAENHELKEKAAAAKTIDEVLERLNQQQNTQKEDPPTDVPDLQKMVEQAVTGLETRKQKESNLLKADTKMKEVFGDKAAEKFAEVASTPELKAAYMQLAAVDPDKFVSLFAGNVPKNTAVETGSVNTTNMSVQVTQRTTTVGTKEYFDNIRRTSPAKYYSQDFQLMMDKAVRGNPDLYYGK